jgi:hypothetical protein
MVTKKSIRKSISEYLAVEKETAENIFTQLFLYICSLEIKDPPDDLYILGKLLKAEDVKKVIDYYDGDYLRVPRKEEYRISMLVALCFFLKVIKGYDWSDIKDFIQLPENGSDVLSPISLGRKINNIQKQLGKDIVKALQTLEIENLDKLFGYFSDVKSYIRED